jgi:ABC-type multidrug transport system ATPase subunit
MEIVAQKLKKVYKGKITALHELDLQIGSGMFGLLGPNGAGKTTLMRILATLVRPTEGVATIGGYRTDDPNDKWAIRAMLGYLPQELALYGDLSAIEFLEFIAALKEIPPRMQREQIQHVLEATSLTDVAKRRLKTYSGGMKRRVGVAQALLGDPKVLIVDEPTVGLDPQERVRFRNMLTSLAKDRIVILSTHIIEDVAQTCSQLAILHRGALVFTGSVLDFTKSAEGKVWEAEAVDYHPSNDAIVVASLQTAGATRYRLLAETQPHPSAQPATPSLEDAYLWRIQEQHANNSR